MRPQRYVKLFGTWGFVGGNGTHLRLRLYVRLVVDGGYVGLM